MWRWAPALSHLPDGVLCGRKGRLTGPTASCTTEKLHHGGMHSLVMGAQPRRPQDAWHACPHPIFVASPLQLCWGSHRPCKGHTRAPALMYLRRQSAAAVLELTQTLYSAPPRAPALMHQCCLKLQCPRHSSTSCGPAFAAAVTCPSAAPSDGGMLLGTLPDPCNEADLQ